MGFVICLPGAGGPDLPCTAGSICGRRGFARPRCQCRNRGRIGTEKGGGFDGWGCAGRRLSRLAAISRQRPHLSLLATALDGSSCSAQQDRLWLLQRKCCRRRLQAKGARTHVAAWLDRHEVGGQKGQMGIFASVTLVTDRSHPRELSLGAKRRAGGSGRRVRLG